MKRLRPLALLLVLLITSTVSGATGEHLIVVGGPSLLRWEKYKPIPHDHWWANFVHSARIRTEQLRTEKGPDALITWLVFEPGYRARAAQEHQDLIANINSVRDKFHLHLIYFRSGDEVVDYLNHGQARNQMKIASFEYIGHSNARCFMFDYSNQIESVATSWLHQRDLAKLNRGIFARAAFIKSWGCHTGEEMSQQWKAATGTRMLGAIGRTDFATGELPVLSSPGGKWVN